MASAGMEGPVAARSALRQHDVRDDGAGQPAAIGKGEARIGPPARGVEPLAVGQPRARRRPIGIDRHLGAPEHGAIGEFEQRLAAIGIVLARGEASYAS